MDKRDCFLDKMDIFIWISLKIFLKIILIWKKWFIREKNRLFGKGESYDLIMIFGISDLFRNSVYFFVVFVILYILSCYW